MFSVEPANAKENGEGENGEGKEEGGNISLVPIFEDFTEERGKIYPDGNGKENNDKKFLFCG